MMTTSRIIVLVAIGLVAASSLSWADCAADCSEAANKALLECRPYGGTSCKIERQVCSGAR